MAAVVFVPRGRGALVMRGWSGLGSYGAEDVFVAAPVTASQTTRWTMAWGMSSLAWTRVLAQGVSDGEALRAGRYMAFPNPTYLGTVEPVAAAWQIDVGSGEVLRVRLGNGVSGFGTFKFLFYVEVIR